MNKEFLQNVHVRGLAHPVVVAEDAKAVSSGCTGLRVWSASEVFVEELLSCGRELQGLTVVELGCGCGLVGTVAAIAGGKVILTDRDQGCLNLAKATADANRDAISSSGGSTAHVALDWSWPLGVDGLPYRSADLVLGCELVYDYDSAAQLPRVVKELLRPPSQFHSPSPTASMRSPGAAEGSPSSSPEQIQEGGGKEDSTSSAEQGQAGDLKGARFLCLLGVRDTGMMDQFLTCAYSAGLELVGEPRKVDPSPQALQRAALYHHDLEITTSNHAWSGYIWLEMRLRRE